MAVTRGWKWAWLNGRSALQCLHEECRCFHCHCQSLLPDPTADSRSNVSGSRPRTYTCHITLIVDTTTMTTVVVVVVAVIIASSAHFVDNFVVVSVAAAAAAACCVARDLHCGRLRMKPLYLQPRVLVRFQVRWMYGEAESLGVASPSHWQRQY